MIEAIIDAILDGIDTAAAIDDGDWTASVAIQAAEDPPPADDDEAA